VGEAAETLAVLARVALHDSGLRQFLAIGLADIEYVGSPKPRDRNRSLVWLLVVLGLPANDGSENQDALLALLHEAAKLVPRTESSDVTSIRFLRSDQQHIVKTVAVKASDGFETFEIERMARESLVVRDFEVMEV